MMGARTISREGGRRRWAPQDVPDQTGRVAIVTGSNSGIGYETAAVLAEHGATVLLACRDGIKALVAAERIVATIPGALVELVSLDLADLDSVRKAAAEVTRRHPQIDLLLNNAGVAWPSHTLSSTGVELQFAVNHLGHFALTGLLLPPLLATHGSRVVTVTSIGHWAGSLDFDDLGWVRQYRPFFAYARSKLANLMFTFELQRRLQRAGSSTLALAAHPGGSRTELIRNPLVIGPRLLRAISQFQSAAMGALPTLRAATDPSVQGGQIYGPDGILELWGHPKPVGSSRRSRDEGSQKQLWEVSEALTGVHIAV